MTKCVNSFKETKYISFLFKINQVLQNSIKFGIKSATQYNKSLIAELVNNGKYLETKGGKSNSNFLGKNTKRRLVVCAYEL